MSEAARVPRPSAPFTERLQTYITEEIAYRLRSFGALERTSQARIVNEALNRMLPTPAEIAALAAERAETAAIA